MFSTNAVHPDPPPYYKAAEPPLPPNYNQNYLPEVGPYSDPYKASKLTVLSANFIEAY